mgnify:CR=1 FL=1
MFRSGRLLWPMLLVLGAEACATDAEYDWLRLTKTSWSPAGYETYVGSDQIELPAGIVQEVEAKVEYKGSRYLIGSYVELSSQNDYIFSVFSMGKKNEFLLVGRTRGQTCMDVTVNGEWEECIDVAVE